MTVKDMAATLPLVRRRLYSKPPRLHAENLDEKPPQLNPPLIRTCIGLFIYFHYFNIVSPYRIFWRTDE